MADPLIKRLRGQLRDGIDSATVMRHAADRIDALAAQVRALTEERDHIQRGFNAAVASVASHQARIEQLEKILLDIDRDIVATHGGYIYRSYVHKMLGIDGSREKSA